MCSNAVRDETFSVPIVRGMARTKPKERSRKRFLTDDEIRAMWTALDRTDDTHEEKGAEPMLFAALVRTLLLTAQRRDEVSRMARSEIVGGVWMIPASRHKTGKTGDPKVIPLSEETLAEIEKVQRPNTCDFIFSTNRETPFSGFSRAKRR